MRRVRYQVACSLDGFIAGPNGEIDWITGGADFDFGELFSQFDTLIMGRRTYQQLPDGPGTYGAQSIVVVSRTLRQDDHPGVEITADPVGVIEDLRSRPGKDIWLFGGGELFRSLLMSGQVDTIEPAVIPVVLGGGVPMYPPPFPRANLRLERYRQYQGGMVLMEYAVDSVGNRGG